jgi:hypothetical protein
MEPPLMAVGNDFVIPILGHDALGHDALWHFSRNVACAKRLFLKSTVRDITAACQFNCVPSLEFLVTQLDQDVFAIVNHPKDSNITCDGHSTPLPNPEVGALQIKTAWTTIDSVYINAQTQHDSVSYDNFQHLESSMEKSS